MEPIILPRISDKKPLVSVVSITYNHEPYIRDCLEGFLMQKTNFPIEIIIHDDASTDHTADILREYYEKRPDLFHIIIEQKNINSQGRSSLLETMQRAKGKYIAICEGDDYWTDPLKLQKQFEFLEVNYKYSLCFHKVEEKMEIYTKNHLRQKSGTVRDKDIYPVWTIPTCSVLIRKEVTKEYESIRKKYQGLYCGDIVLFLLAAKIGLLYGLPQKMGVYRRNSGGLTQTSRNMHNLRGILAHQKAIKKAFPNLKEQANTFIVFSYYRSIIQDPQNRKKYINCIKMYAIKYHFLAIIFELKNLANKLSFKLQSKKDMLQFNKKTN